MTKYHILNLLALLGIVLAGCKKQEQETLTPIIKKLGVLVFTLLFCGLESIGQNTITTNVETNTAMMEKHIVKEAKKNAKKLHKNGWKLYGSTDKLEDVLKNHYRKQTGNEVIEIRGVAPSVDDLETGFRMAFDNAIENCVFTLSSLNADCSGYVELENNGYFQMRSSKDSTTISFTISEEGCRSTIVCDTAYVNWIKKDLEKGYTFTIYKQESKGVFEMQSYFTIEPKYPNRAR